MKTHITTLNNMAGTASLAHRRVLKVAQSIGCHEMGLSFYPNVKMSVLDSLFEKCDFYLDINHEGEIVDAVHRAFLNNMLIVGYEETMHNAYYTADTNTFKESEYADMAEALNLTLAMPHLIDEALAMQKKAAVAADATDYMEILHL